MDVRRRLEVVVPSRPARLRRVEDSGRVFEELVTVWNGEMGRAGTSLVSPLTGSKPRAWPDVSVAAMTLAGRVKRAIARVPWRTATEIARALKADPAYVSSALRKLELRGAVVRAPDCGPRGGDGWRKKERGE